MVDENARGAQEEVEKERLAVRGLTPLTMDDTHHVIHTYGTEKQKQEQFGKKQPRHLRRESSKPISKSFVRIIVARPVLRWAYCIL